MQDARNRWVQGIVGRVPRRPAAELRKITAQRATGSRAFLSPRGLVIVTRIEVDSAKQLKNFPLLPPSRHGAVHLVVILSTRLTGFTRVLLLIHVFEYPLPRSTKFHKKK
jgi:hypothetical protein